MKTITINGKDIEISEESFEELKKQLVPEKFEFKYPHGTAYVLHPTYIDEEGAGKDVSYKEYGRYRKTKEAADKSFNRNTKANRLEALVEQIQGDLEGNYYIFSSSMTWVSSYIEKRQYYPEAVLMKRSTALKICDILNNGSFSLDIE